MSSLFSIKVTIKKPAFEGFTKTIITNINLKKTNRNIQKFLSKLPEMVKDREASHAAVHGVGKSRT